MPQLGVKTDKTGMNMLKQWMYFCSKSNPTDYPDNEPCAINLSAYLLCITVVICTSLWLKKYSCVHFSVYIYLFLKSLHNSIYNVFYKVTSYTEFYDIYTWFSVYTQEFMTSSWILAIIVFIAIGFWTIREQKFTQVTYSLPW